MKQVFKTQCYSLRHSYDLFFLGLIMMILTTSEVAGFYVDEATPNTTAVDVVGVGGMYGVILLAGIMAIAVGQDFSDKTVNYDVLFGVPRKKVFLGRLFAGLVGAMILATLFYVIPCVYSLIVDGWERTIPFYTLGIRFLGGTLSLFRVAVEVSFFAIILKKGFLTFGISLALGLVETLVTASIEKYFSVFPWVTAANVPSMWYMYEQYEKFGENGGTIIVTEALPDINNMVVSIGSSILIIVLCLILAIKIFEKQDL